MSNKNLKLPPQNIESEVSVLGALMIDKHASARVADTLIPTDFYNPAHHKIYEAIIDLFEKGKPVDLLTVSTRLKEKKHLKEIGGAGYLTDLINSVPTSAHVEHYANIVREQRVRRDLISASSEIHEQALEHKDFETLLDEVEKRIFNISQRSRTQRFAHLKDELPIAYERLEKIHQGGKENKLRGIATGFEELDHKYLSGLQKADLIILGARPSFGKTAMALDIARRAALAGKSVGVFSLEMSKEQVVDRIMAAQAQVRLWDLRTGKIQDEDFVLIQKALSELSDTRLFIEDTASPNILHIRSMARKLQLEHGLDLLIVDYLQLIMPRINSDSMVQQVTEISRGLKSLARELNIPVLAVSQLSRAVDQREIKIPRLSDLRESGCLRGDSEIQLASGRKITIKELAGRKQQNPIKTLALDENYRLKTFTIERAFSSGIKRVYKLTTRSGREIHASANHPFLRIDGWKKLNELQTGDHIALPRTIPAKTEQPDALSEEELILHAHLTGDGCILPRQPYHYTNAYLENINQVNSAAEKLFGIKGKIIKQKNWYHTYLKSPYHLTHGRVHPITSWYERLGIGRVRSYEKQISPKILECGNKKIALFLKHLWATDGNLSWKILKGRLPAGNIYYASSSPILANQVQYLLLRLGIQSTKSKKRKGDYRPMYHITIQGRDNQLKFLRRVGIADRRQGIVPKAIDSLERINQNPNNDIIPKEAWSILIKPVKEIAGISWREFSASINTAYCGTSLFKNGLSRERMMRVSTALKPKLQIKAGVAPEIIETLENVARSDVYWDEIINIEAEGEEEVYDITVKGAHNFIANDIIVHNSIEQDADVVLFLYRKDREKMDVPEEEKNLVEVIIAKHRNGPTGSVQLRFDPEMVTFRNIDRIHSPEGE